MFSASVLVLFAATLHGTFVVRVKAYPTASFASKTFSLLGVAIGGSCGCGFREEEGKEFIRNGEVGSLLELLEGEKAEEGFKER